MRREKKAVFLELEKILPNRQKKKIVCEYYWGYVFCPAGQQRDRRTTTSNLQRQYDKVISWNDNAGIERVTERPVLVPV
ncbi:MAG: hypothetical protein ACLSGB_16185 [Dorea sp.]